MTMMWVGVGTAAVGAGSAIAAHNNKPGDVVAPTLANPITPGAVSGTYGGSYIDPVTGRVVYASNTTAPQLQQYQDQNTYNQLMGYGGGSQDLTNQISQQQKTLEALKAQGPGSAKLSDFLGKEWIGEDGKVLDYTKYINKRGADNPLWESFMASTGGKYGSNNPDISFSKWAKDTNARNVAPALQNFDNAEKTIKGNTATYQQQLQDEQAKLDSLTNIQSQVSGTGSSSSANPMLSYLQHGPNQANYISQQVTDQYNNAQRQADQQMASRGMGSSSMSELARGANANALSQGILGAQVTGGQNNFNNLTTALNMLSGNKNAANATQATNTGLYNQQMGMGQSVGQNQSNQQTQQQAAQLGMNMNAQQANANSQLASNAQMQSAISSGVQGFGSAMGSYNTNNQMQNWLNNQNRTTSSGSTVAGASDFSNPTGGGSNAWAQYT